MTVVTGLVAFLFVGETGDWAKRAARRLASLAASAFPPERKAAYREEFLSELEALPSGVAQLGYALRLLSSVIFVRWRPSQFPEVALDQERRRFTQRRMIAATISGFLSGAVVVTLLVLSFGTVGVTPNAVAFASAAVAILTSLLTIAYAGLLLRDKRTHEREGEDADS